MSDAFRLNIALAGNQKGTETGPATIWAASWAPNRLDIFGLGTDNGMYHKAWDGSRWAPSMTDWESLGGTFNSA